MAEPVITCSKCFKTSGDDWSQCNGVCPMPMSPHYNPMPRCQICRKRQAAFICSSSLGAMSLAYCNECHAVGAEPYDYLVGAIWAIGSLELFGDGDTITASLQVAGKTREQLMSDLAAFDKCAAEMERKS